MAPMINSNFRTHLKVSTPECRPTKLWWRRLLLAILALADIGAVAEPRVFFFPSFITLGGIGEHL